METNNTILFTFGIFFLFMGFLSPLINSEFGDEVTSYDIDKISEDLGDDVDITQTPTEIMRSVGVILSGIFFWTFGIPIWLNLVFVMMRLIFVVILYDKLRGI